MGNDIKVKSLGWTPISQSGVLVTECGTQSHKAEGPWECTGRRWLCTNQKGRYPTLTRDQPCQYLWSWTLAPDSYERANIYCLSHSSPVFARESLENSFKKCVTSFVSNYLRSHNAQKWALGKLILKNEIPGPFWTYPWFDFIMCGSSIFVKLLLWLAIPLVLSIPIMARIKSSYAELLQQWQCLYGQTAESVPGADGKPGERK